MHPSSEEGAVLRAEHLTKHYGPVVALDDLNLSIAAGEVVGLLGPNGAGKTTTINLALGVLSPTAGQVLLFGRELARHRSELLRRTNFASAYAGLPKNLTLRENLAIFADFYEVAKPRRRIATVLAELDLESLADRPIMRLSAGQRMRAVLAKALLSEPELLLLDEPTASLDPDTADRVRAYLGELAVRGVTLLWTSHNMVEVERFCSRVVFLHGGRIVLDGPPRELVRRSGKVLVRVRPRGPASVALAPRFAERLQTTFDGWLELAATDDAEAAALIAEVQLSVGVEGLELRPPTLEDLFVRLAREGAA
jgi:ABC-2 type transport system ATP-binding protein